MTIVNQQIENFRQFLIAAWTYLDNLMENHDWDDDGDFIDEWLQINWEFLVERELLGPKQFLKSYGFTRSRFTNPTAKATYVIICKPKEGCFLIDDKTKKHIPDHFRLVFRIFERKKENSFGIYPPFDYAFVEALENKEQFDIPINDIDFHLEPLDLTQQS